MRRVLQQRAVDVLGRLGVEDVAADELQRQPLRVAVAEDEAVDQPGAEVLDPAEQRAETIEIAMSTTYARLLL